MKKRTMPFVIAIFLFISLIFYLPSGQCEETITDDTKTTFSSIQEAIDTTFEGDTIYIYGGEYYEDILINKSVNLEGKSLNGYAPVIIGNVTITTNNVTISNLFIQDAIGINIGLGFIINNEGIGPSEPIFVFFELNNITIKNNVIKNNSEYGISAKWINNVNIIGNVIENNNDGIFLQNVKNSTIKENTFEKNEQYGIFILSNKSINNQIYHNSFINNTINAYDESLNLWNELKEGNYWSDYEGIDRNLQDGIGDTPYDIPGGDNQDNYPLMSPYTGVRTLQNYYVDRDLVQIMLIAGIIFAIIFCLPIGLWWRKKYFK